MIHSPAILPSSSATISSVPVSRATPMSWKLPLSSTRASYALSFAYPSTLSPPSMPPLNSTLRSISRGGTCPCVLSSPDINSIVEKVKEKDALEAQLANCNLAYEDKDSNANTFLGVKSEEELLSVIRNEAETGRLSSSLAASMEELYYNYRNAILKSGSPVAEKVVLSNMAVVFDRIHYDVKDPYIFSPYHKALREPFDYYTFGQNYIRPLIDFGNSFIGNIAIFNELEEQLKLGHNVILISNHQTEADPAIISLMLEKTNPFIAENLIYVAGDRVITDPLCKPFSMGRNLICVYSKKHMNDAPELVEMKKKANMRSLKELAMLFRSGSKIVWIAPSGGRDRPDPLTGECYPERFDPSSVENIRRLSEYSEAPGHIYPLSLLCHDIMPPPLQVEKTIGERRVISFSGTGLSIAPEVSYDLTVPDSGKSEATEFTEVLYRSVTEQYDVLRSARVGKGLQSSTPTVSLSQPWK